MRETKILSSLLFVCFPLFVSAEDATTTFVSRFCTDCHGETTQEATLDLTSLPRDFGNADHFRRWVKVHDRIAAGEMPPKDADQPNDVERATMLKALGELLVAAERATAKDVPRLRRLTRAEYENTIRDLFGMPGIALAGSLPADGSAHGFDKHPEALDISHVNVQKYLEAADHILNYAIATRPQPPTIRKRRISLVNRGGFVAHIVMNGDGVLLKNKQIDPEFPPAAEQNHLDQGAHERWGSFRNGATVGLFRHEDESVSPYFIEHVTIYPARYRVRTSLWSFQWDQGKMLPGRGAEAARLSVVQLTGDGRGGQHPSYALGYFDAPDTKSLEHELVDWLDIEGPLYESWPPRSHKLLFGDLPIAEFVAADHPKVRPPTRVRARQIGAGMNRPDPEPGLWTVQSEDSLKDADRLLASFLPKLFRRPVSDEVRQQYVSIVRERLEVGDCFELAMRAAYRNALVAPDFLYHIETVGWVSDPTDLPQRNGRVGDPTYRLDDYALACGLSYFLWNSLPDEQLMQHAEEGDLRDPHVLHGEVERLLAHPHSQRFVNDFLGQYQKLIASDSTCLLRNLMQQFAVYATGRAVRFSDRHAIDEIVRRTQSKGGGIRTLLHELNGSPLFTGGAKTIEQPANLKQQKVIANTNRRMMMVESLPNVENPAVAKTAPMPEDKSVATFRFDDEDSVAVQVTGLFMPERVDDFRRMLKEFPEAKLLNIDFKTAQATLAYAADSDLFRGAKPEQIIERLNNRVRQISGYTLAIKPLSTVLRDKLERVEIPIIGLDCKACTFAVYGILDQIDGVEQATASFHDGLAIAWIDPDLTNRAALEEALKKRGVKLVSP